VALWVVNSEKLKRNPAPPADGRASPTSRWSFVKIPAGEFQMGSDLWTGEMPAHRVIISRPFEMGKFEVTQAQWKAVMGSDPSYFKGAGRPVENVSWNDVQDFLTKLNLERDDFWYRLPTEAEWEYAGRAGGRRSILLGSWRPGPGSTPTRAGRTTPWDASSPTPGGCTTCWGTSGSGVRTGTTRATTRSALRRTQPAHRRAPIACFVAAAGSSPPNSSACRTAGGTRPAPAP